MKSLILYCYFQKFSEASAPETKDLKSKMAELEAKNAKLKETVSKQDEELLLLGHQQAVIQTEASEAITARIEAKAKVAKLLAEVEGLWAEVGELQKDNSIINKDLGQLEETHVEVSKQLKVAQDECAYQKTMLENATKATVIAEEKLKFFNSKYVKARAQLKKAKAQAANYLRQLSFASWVWNSVFADELILGFETFRTWAKDPTHSINLDEVNIEDILSSDAAMSQLTNLGQEQMPDTVGMKDFTYDPFAKKMNQGSKGTKTIPGKEKTSEAVSIGSTPAETSPVVDPKRGMYR